MTGRVKESIFNVLRGWFEGTVVLDLFAGVGTMGLESISHGARLAIFFERDRAVCDCLRRNIAMLRVGEQSRVMQADALSPAAIAAISERIDVAFVDPPYPIAEQQSGRRKILDQCVRLRSVMGDQGFLVLRLPYELAEDEKAIAGFVGPEVRAYGDMYVHFYAPHAVQAATEDSSQ